MEIKAYNPQFQLLGIIENYSSLQWNRKYSAAGDFELHIPISLDNFNYFTRGNIVSYPGAIEAGVVESITASQDNKSNEFVIKGRFLESYLDRRLIYNHSGQNPAYTFSGKVEVAMRTILQIAAITNHPIPFLRLGELNNFSETTQFQATYQNLLKYESKLADSASFGFRCIPDFVEKTITFDVYKGLDHSENQSDRVRVTFSDDFRNLNSVTYTENDQLLKTVCYVGGQGEGEARVWVTVGDDSLTGLERREVKLNATDISQNNMSLNDYKQLLAKKGEDLLNTKDIMVCSFESETIPYGNFKYKEHFDLGDIVTVKKENWGLAMDLRITEITEIYERDGIKIVPTFGNPLPTTIDWEDK